jgi:hypothetical protein
LANHAAATLLVQWPKREEVDAMRERQPDAKNSSDGKLASAQTTSQD